MFYLLEKRDIVESDWNKLGFKFVLRKTYIFFDSILRKILIWFLEKLTVWFLEKLGFVLRKTYILPIWVVCLKADAEK